MKNIILSLLLVLCLAFVSEAQNKVVNTDLVWTSLGGATNIVDNSTAITYTFYVNPFASYTKFALKNVNVAGTSTTIFRPYQSMDYVNWTALDSASCVGAAAETVTAVITAFAPYFKWVIIGAPGVQGHTKVTVTNLVKKQ
jgi:hypothetical protein